jgi:hypothetical protein
MRKAHPVSSKRNKRKRKRNRAGHGREAEGRPAGRLHFTIGTGPSSDPSTGHLSLQNDVRLLKAGLLYADRVRLCSFGSSLTLRMLADTKSHKNQQLDFIERHFRENIARDDPEEAAKAIKFVRRYRELRRDRHLSKEQLVLRAQLAEEFQRIWGRFKGGWEEFARKAGADEILAAKRSGLVDFYRFAAGGVERTAGLDRSSNERRSDEFYEEVTAELFGVLSGAVSEGVTYPLFDDQAGELIRKGVDAGVIRVPESGATKGRQAGLASHLLRHLPLFEAAPVDEILSIRRELDGPLTRFRNAVARFSDGMRAAGWDREFIHDADNVFVREVGPAVREIEDAVRDSSFVAQLLPSMTAPHNWAAGGAPGVAAYNLASLPELASLAMGGGVGFASGVREAYLEWRKARREVERKELFFYYEAGRRLGTA